jgi:hypothetical protein
MTDVEIKIVPYEARDQSMGIRIGLKKSGGGAHEKANSPWYI